MRHCWFRFLCFALGVLCIISPVSAAPSLSVIRDTEIETTIRTLATPIFKAAKLKPENIQIILINDPQINAFVAGGMKLFIYTGLLTEFKKANVLQGVIAHETGHIADGHLARGSERYLDAALGTTLGYVLGAAAAVGGSPQAGMAIIAGSNQINQREILQFSRENEQAADQAGLNFLDKTQTSSKGLFDLLQFLSQKENLLYGDINPYTMTHPLSRERVSHIRNHLESSPYKNNDGSDALKAAYTRCYVKLRAFLQPATATLNTYPATNHSLEARYARAIAYYKMPDIPKSLAEIDSLIADYPKDPYFYELKGQVLYENSRINESIAPYAKAVALMPGAPLLQLALATAQIASVPEEDGMENNPLLAEATSHLLEARRKEPDNSAVLQQLVIAYGRQGKLGLSYLFQAEGAMLGKDKALARRYAELAKKNLPPDSPELLRVNDILNNIDTKKKSQNPLSRVLGEK